MVKNCQNWAKNGQRKRDIYMKVALSPQANFQHFDIVSRHRENLVRMRLMGIILKLAMEFAKSCMPTQKKTMVILIMIVNVSTTLCKHV